jgi:peptide-methionine (S)-S-oxide reductase
MFPFTPPDKKTMIGRDQALPGRAEAMPVPPRHAVLKTPMVPPFPAGSERVAFGMGCFWGAEKLFWTLPGIITTAVGYAGGYTPNPTYEEVCRGRTGHAEVVLVIYHPERIGFDALLRAFWQGHDPTQGMRQGHDVGTQYRSVIHAASDEQLRQAEKSARDYQRRLRDGGFGAITTEIVAAPPFFYAEGYHQQYLAKNPGGYCGLGGTGVRCG